MKSVTRMKGQSCRPRRQRGAVAIMLGVSLLVLFGFMALVFDLGRTYVVRTELQNAADAAALAGAKDLNGKLAGITQSIATVKAIGLQNNTRFSFNNTAGITIADAMISVSSCPDGCAWTQASTITTEGQAADKTFLKVEIPSGNLATFFARIPTTTGGTGIPETRTYGRAVAGYFQREITPIGICAIDAARSGTRPAGALVELTEFGFRRGVSYNIMELGPLGGSGQPYLLNPVDAWPSPECDPSHSSASYTAPFVCTGTSASVAKVPGDVFGNTGISAGKIQVALNSRFNVNACAPQDVNVKTYDFAATGAGSPASWMEPDPSRQSIRIDSATHKPVSSPSYADYGVLWSYSRAMQAVVPPPPASAPYTAGAEFSPGDWTVLYGGTSNYPATGPAPYDAGGDYATPPPVTPGKKDRRVLNLAIVNCPVSTGTGCNSTIRVEAIGKFFMQVKADLPKSIDAEFAGLIDPPPTDIRLYK